jgi:hypothetical protein
MADKYNIVKNLYLKTTFVKRNEDFLNGKNPLIRWDAYNWSHQLNNYWKLLFFHVPLG